MSGKRGPRRTMSWDEWYKLASQYRDEHGDLLIPRDYVCAAGQKLGRWIERQRAKYNGVSSVPGHLDRTQIALLNRIGMVWKLEYRHAWRDWLEKLDWYRGIYGDIDIPGDFEHGGYHLGNWIIEQRKNRLAGVLSEAEISDLDARGMLWNVRTRPRLWDEWYADAEAYYREYGDLMVKLDYRTPSGDKLGAWIYRQRDAYMGRRKGVTLASSQIEQLEAIGMIWDPVALHATDWDDMYRWVAAYYERHSRLPLWPRDIKAPDGRSMCGWIRTQRQQLALGRIPRARELRLAELGILPAQRREKRAEREARADG